MMGGDAKIEEGVGVTTELSSMTPTSTALSSTDATMTPPSEPTSPPLCENCSDPAELQCGYCNALYFCKKGACFEALHPRVRDREMHHASVTSYGTSSHCALHPEYKLHFICESPDCGDALICIRCDKIDHAGHTTSDVSQYIARLRRTLSSHAEALTDRIQTANKKCSELESHPPHKARCKGPLLENRISYLGKREDLMRRELEDEEEMEFRCLMQALGEKGQVCDLKAFVVKAEKVIGECEALCLLGDDQAVRVVAESQAVVRSIAAMETEGVAGSEEVTAESVARKERRERKYSAIAALEALDETITAERLRTVADSEVAWLLLQAEVATEIPNNFLFGNTLTQLDLSAASVVTKIGAEFLSCCESLTTIDVSGWGMVSAIGGSFLADCKRLKALDLSPLKSLTKVGIYFLYGCVSLRAVNLSGLSIAQIGDNFLTDCKRLTGIDLSALHTLTHIGKSFLSGCRRLAALDLAPLSNVTAIGAQFLRSCTSLSELDLSPLGSVVVLDDGFLDECTSLTLYVAGCSSTVLHVVAAFPLSRGIVASQKRSREPSPLRSCKLPRLSQSTDPHTPAAGGSMMPLT